MYILTGCFLVVSGVALVMVWFIRDVGIQAKELEQQQIQWAIALRCRTQRIIDPEASIIIKGTGNEIYPDISDLVSAVNRSWGRNR